jgi:hypothetical protein
LEQFYNIFLCFCCSGLVLLIHIVEDPGKLQVVVLDVEKNLETLNELRSLVEFEAASNKIGILVNQNVIENLLPEMIETFENAKDKIQVELT